MASGAARRMHKATGQPVVIVGVDGRPRWSPLWEGLPYILHRGAGRPFVRMINGPNARPYIAAKSITRWAWRPYKPEPAQIVFTPAELAFAAPFRGMVVIEPNVKNIGHDNKAWLPMRWIDLSKTRSDFVQCVSSPDQALPHNVLKVITPTFRHAAAVLSVAKAFVGTEGGLMHAAAAVGTPSVILWSEFISPEITGYSTMTNLRHAGKPCGNRLACASCRKSMEAITVDEVTRALERILK